MEAFAVIEGSSRVRLTSGEKSRSPAGAGRCSARASSISALTSPPPPESPATNSRSGRVSRREEALVHGGGVDEAGRKRELRCKAVVGNQHFALSLVREPTREHEIHGGGGADVTTSVEVEDLASRSSATGSTGKRGDASDLYVRQHDVKWPEQGGQSYAAQIIDDDLERSKLRRWEATSRIR